MGKQGEGRKMNTSCFSCDIDFEVEDQNDREEGYFCDDCIVNLEGATSNE